MVKDNIENPCSSYDVVVDTINHNGVYVNDKNVDVYEVDVQPDLQEKTVEYTENGEYLLKLQAKINVSIPNSSTAVTINQNGTTTLTPESGYYNQVDIDVQVPDPALESKTVDITQNGSTTITPDSEYGLSSVTVNTNVQPALQNKTVEYTENGEYSVTNDEEFYGLKEVKINVSIPNVSTAVTITENGTTILTPESGYYNQVNIDVQVPDPELERKTIDITQNGTIEIEPDSAYYGLSNVTVNTNVQPQLQEKEILIGINERKEITPDTEYYGLSKVTVQSPNVPLQNKEITITENGSTRLMPDEGYYALHIVDVNVNVPEPTLESKTVNITSNGTMNITPDSEYGLSNVTVNTNVQPKLQNKDVNIAKNGTTTITKDNGYDGLGNVTVTTNVEGGGSIGNYIKIETPFTGGKILGSTLDITKWDLNIQQYSSTFEGFGGLNKIILPIDYFYVENRNDFNEEKTFYNCSSLTEIENIDKTRISINRFSNTFRNCKNLTSLDLSYKPEYNYWDMSGVKDISYMFNECNSLTTLNIDGWDRAKLSYTQYAFATCNNLKGIIRLSAHNAIDNNNMFSRCQNLDEIYYDNDGYDNIEPNKEVCDMTTFAYLCMNLKKASIKGRKIYKDGFMFSFCNTIEWVDMTGCDYSKYMSGNTSTGDIQLYHNSSKLKTLIGDHTLAEVENGDITIYDGLGLSQPRFNTYYFSPLSSLRYSSMLAIAKGLGQHTYTSTQYIRFNTTAWANMYNDDDTIPDSETITQRQNTLTDLITGKGWRIQTAND